MVGRDEFVTALAAVCTPVSVVTSHHRDRPHGTTVSAFCSLSLDPPMVLVSLDRGSDLLAMVSESERFGVNVLAHDQGELARQFARKGADKFDGVEWDLHLGVPRLASEGAFWNPRARGCFPRSARICAAIRPSSSPRSSWAWPDWF